MYTILATSTAFSPSNGSNISMVGPLLFLILSLIFVLFLAQYSRKFMERSKFGINRTSNIRLVETLHIGFQNTVHILKVGEKYILVSASKDKVSFLCDLDKGDLNFDDLPQNPIKIPFEKYMNKYFKAEPPDDKDNL